MEAVHNTWNREEASKTENLGVWPISEDSHFILANPHDIDIFLLGSLRLASFSFFFSKNSKRFHLIPIDSVWIEYFDHCRSISRTWKPKIDKFQPISTGNSGKFRLVRVDSVWNQNFWKQQSILHSPKPWNVGWEYC